MNLEIMSANVNGLRAAHKKGFADFLAQQRPWIVGLQEVRATLEQLPTSAAEPPNYRAHFSPAQRAGYSGVGLYVSELCAPLVPSFGIPSLDAVAASAAAPSSEASTFDSFDNEGRIQSVRLGQLLVVNGYFPNGNGKERDNSRVPYKLEFYERLRAYLEPERRAGTKILVMGDWNTAHHEVDLARPKENVNTSGFLAEERAAMDLWTNSGWVDTFRHIQPSPSAAEIKELEQAAKHAGLKKAERALHPGEGRYTWWSQRGGARAKNVGWRIDYIFCSPNVLPYLRNATIYSQVLVSDHCPISVHLDEAVLG
jgi:exodeoxyribonuclease III